MSDSCTRRQAIRSLVGGSILLPGLLSKILADENRADPLSPKASHFPARAKQVIFLFTTGGTSHLDTVWPFKPAGSTGTMVSDLLPHIRERMGDIALINSMKSDDNEHFQATLAMHTGSFFFSRPSIGSWVSYGLGTLNQNLPSFMVLAPNLPYAGTQGFANDFLPAYHQGTRIVPGPEPIPDLAKRSRAPGLQEKELGLANAFDRDYLKANGNDSELAARIKSYETAFRMQTE